MCFQGKTIEAFSFSFQQRRHVEETLEAVGKERSSLSPQHKKKGGKLHQSSGAAIQNDCRHYTSHCFHIGRARVKYEEAPAEGDRLLIQHTVIKSYHVTVDSRNAEHIIIWHQVDSSTNGGSSAVMFVAFPRVFMSVSWDTKLEACELVNDLPVTMKASNTVTDMTNNKQQTANSVHGLCTLRVTCGEVKAAGGFNQLVFIVECFHPSLLKTRSYNELLCTERLQRHTSWSEGRDDATDEWKPTEHFLLNTPERTSSETEATHELCRAAARFSVRQRVSAVQLMPFRRWMSTTSEVLCSFLQQQQTFKQIFQLFLNATVAATAECAEENSELMLITWDDLKRDNRSPNHRQEVILRLDHLQEN
ncbi:uncharacterized protein V6R79_006619 [Siganus canaliculatus]